MLRYSWMAGLALLAALVLTVRIEEGRVRKEQGRVAELALAASNAMAERDSTRDAAVGSRAVAELLGDSLRIAERRVVQVTQRGDELDRALGRERRARYLMAVRADSLVRVASGVALADSGHGMRRARFDLYQAPYKIAADVGIPLPPDPARMTVAVALDPIPVELRLHCAAADRDGVRAASIDAMTPKWATVRFDRVEQAPELCAPPVIAGRRGRSHGVAFSPLVGGFGRALMLDGRWRWAIFVGGGFSGWN